MKRSVLIETGRVLRTTSKNEFRIVDHVGTGGNSVVYAVVVIRGPLQGALLALRLFLQLDDPVRKKQFVREGEFLMQERAPALIHVYETGNLRLSGKDGTEDHPYHLTKLYGMPLSIALRSEPPLVYKVLWGTQLLSAIKRLGALDDWVVHRDVKPSNIFLDGPSAVLADFGMMKSRSELAQEKASGDEVLRTGMPQEWRTPDLVRYLRDGSPFSPASDVFQLGLVFANLFLGGNPLKRGETNSDVELRELGEGRGEFSDEIKSVIERMLLPDPEQRESVDVLLDDWDGILQSVCRGFSKLEGRVIFRSRAREIHETHA